MKTIIAIVAAVALVALATPVNAHDTEVPTPVGTYYISPSIDHASPDSQVWEETNGVPGLQKVAWEDENGRLHPADTRHA